MKPSKFRVIVPLVVLLLAGIGFAFSTGWGTLSAIGWQDISILCPLGALGTMLASKMVLPRPVISIVIAIVAIIVLGRAFCGWICPVPVIERLRTIFKRQEPAAGDEKNATAAEAKTDAEGASDAKGADGADNAGSHAAAASALSEKEVAEIKKSVNKSTAACGACKKGCGTAPSNSRHIVLGGALLSAAIFGFPVFCLVCPIGLSFAFVFVLIMLFGTGDVTWSVILIPAILLVELVFFRKWCSHICPLSSLMSLVGKLNRTFRPSIDDSKCLETAHGLKCGRCADVCEVAIDPRHPELGASMNECIRCNKCVEVCPGKALSIPLLPKKAEGAAVAKPPTKEG